jgi:hypothetical protein
VYLTLSSQKHRNAPSRSVALAGLWTFAAGRAAGEKNGDDARVRWGMVHHGMLRPLLDERVER